MNPILLTLSYLFGLIPLNRLNEKSNQFFDYVLMICMPLLYLVSYALANLSGFAVYQLPGCGSICSLGNTLFIHLGCFLYTTISFFIFCRRKRFFVRFSSNLKEIDERIVACHKLADDKMKLPPNRHVYYFTWVLVLAIFIFALVFDIIEMIHHFKQFFFVVNMAVTFPFFVGSIVQGQFIYYVSVISLRFTEINSLFNKISKECDKKHAPITIYDIESDTKDKDAKKPKQVYHSNSGEKRAEEPDVESTDGEDRSADDSDEEGGGAMQQHNTGLVKVKFCIELPDSFFFYIRHTSEANLPELFKLHDKILSLSVLTNAEFGPQCVPYMAVCFVISIFGIFVNTKVMFVVGGKSSLLDYVAYLYVIWSLTTMVVAYLVLRLCCNANGYSKQSAMIVHEIMQKKPVFMLGNDLYYNKMKSFTLQFLHWEGYFQYNGIGLFTLDYTFIFSTVSAATSYLIVLLQFDMSSILKNEGLM